jgi:hypothetical protein
MCVRAPIVECWWELVQWKTHYHHGEQAAAAAAQDAGTFRSKLLAVMKFMPPTPFNIIRYHDKSLCQQFHSFPFMVLDVIISNSSLAFCCRRCS